MENSINFAAYWNGKEDDWTLSKCPNSDEDIPVIVTIEKLKTGKPVGYNVKKAENKFKKVSKELRGLTVAAEKWSK